MRSPLARNVLEPTTVEETLTILRQEGAKAAIISGGTDLVVLAKDGVINPEVMVDIIGLPLSYVRGSASNGFYIGATTTAAKIRSNTQLQKELPVLCSAAKHLGGPQTQELATIGGNICNASPAGNFSNVLLALDARLELTSLEGKREVALKDFFVGPGKTILKEVEMLTEVIIPPLAENTGISYIKHVLRKEMDIAIVGVAVAIVREGNKVADIRISLAAVGPTPLLAKNAEAILTGNQYSEELVEKAAVAAQTEASYIDDVRASADYRRRVTATLVKNAIAEAWIRTKSEGV